MPTARAHNENEKKKMPKRNCCCSNVKANSSRKEALFHALENNDKNNKQEKIAGNKWVNVIAIIERHLKAPYFEAEFRQTRGARASIT